MKYVIGAGVLIALALLAVFLVLQLIGIGIDIHVHDTYWVIPIPKIAFWFLIAITAVLLGVAVYKLVRHRS